MEMVAASRPVSFTALRYVWDSSRQSGAAFTVLLALADYADDTGVAWPSVEALARKARLSERTTHYALSQLNTSGEIVIETGGGRNRPNQYRLRLAETVHGLHPITQAETVQTTTETLQEMHPWPGETVQDLHPFDSERVQSTTQRVQTTAEKGANAAPEPSGTTSSTVGTTGGSRKQKDIEVEEIYAHFRAKIQPTSRTCAAEKIRARLKKFSAAELRQGIDNFSVSPWSMEHNAHRGSAWFFASDARSEMYLHMRPESEEAAEHDPETPHVNGTASKMAPATDEDHAIWTKALDELRPTMRAHTFEEYLQPLEVVGRGEDGGLWLVVNPIAAEHTARMKHAISRALYDAGDPQPAAVRFKARKPKGRNDAE
jgi:cytochrome c556